jgi:DedD protein
MEVRVRERLVGALVLVAIVVLFVPAILRGRAPAPAAPPDAAPTQRVEVPIDSAAPAPEEQILVPEPALPEKRPEVAPAPVPAPDAGPSIPEVAPPPTPSPGPRESATAAPAKPGPAPVPPALASAWAVQLGAFSNKAKAEQLVAELRKRQYAAFMLEYRAGGQVLYRVRVGPEQDRSRAVEIAGRLEKDGFQPVVARHP